MTLRLSDEERGIVLRTLKARLDALHAEMTQTDSPEFNIQLKREETDHSGAHRAARFRCLERPGEDRSQRTAKANREAATVTGSPVARS